MSVDGDRVRGIRLMMFTSLLRLLGYISHARVEQGYTLFLDFECKYPLIDGYTRTGKAVDHRNMKEYINAKFNS